MDGSEDDVEAYGYEEAMDWLEKQNASYEELESLQEMKALIKVIKSKHGHDAASRAHGKHKQNEKDTQKMMQEILSRDQKMKEELSQVYQELVKFINKEVDEEIKEVLEPLYGDFQETVVKYMSELVNDECPIVVAGETSAGKSSLLNLLLGTEVLPHSLLCATSTICRLHNSEEKKFEIVYANGGTETIEVQNEDNWRDKLRQSVSSKESREELKYRMVDIFWPIPMLQDRVTIVDTPGVGESSHMTERLMKYLPNAVAFIYVINSAVAGGIQEDKLLHIIGKQQEWKNEGKLSYFDARNAIFVCNKWDRVKESREEDKVWKDTIGKLKKIIPDLQENQVFKMSTTEAARYKHSGLGYTENFQALLDGIERMVPASLKAKVTMHFRWLDGFLRKLQQIIASRINNARSTEEEKRKLFDSVQRRLSTLRLGTKKVRDDLTLEADNCCKNIVTKLHEYLTSPAVTERLQNWRKEEAPSIEAGDFEVAKFNAEKLIIARIDDELKKWDSENDHVRELADKLTKRFIAECRLLDKECKEVDLMITGNDSGMQAVIAGSSTEREGTESVFTGSEKVILAVASPLWIPLVAAATVLFIPVGVGMFIRETIKDSQKRKDYTKNKEKFMKQWTEEVTKVYFTKENVKKYIEEIYFMKFKEKIKDLCDKFIPRQIEADEKHINIIHKDMRSSQEILNHYNPLQKKLKTVLGRFYLYDLKYMYTDLIDIKALRRVGKIGAGNFSDVFLVDWEIETNVSQRAALKVLRHDLKGNEIYTQLSEVECLRVLRHKNIVEFYGPSYSANDIGDSDSSEDERGFTQSWKDQTGGTLMLVLEYCEGSLETVFENESIRCSTYKSIEERQQAFKFYVTMIAGVCDGLAYIHGKGYLHRDLKVSNVMIKDGVAKISDLGFARLEAAMTGTFTGTLSHMSPEILSNKQYNMSTDIYSLGIMMWELWYGKQVYSEPEYEQYNLPALIALINSGQRPLFKYKFRMTIELEELVKLCWDQDPKIRPSAVEIGRKIRKLYKKYHKEDKQKQHNENTSDSDTSAETDGTVPV